MGYDVDGQVDTATTTHHCQPASGGVAEAPHERNDGIDNSFGRNILPIMLGISSKTPNDDAALAAGGPTLLVTINRVGVGTSYDPLSMFFAGVI